MSLAAALCVLLIVQIAFATPGVELWIRRYDGPGTSREFAHDVGVSPDGSTVFVTGTSGASPTGWDYATVAYASSTGATRWVSRRDGLGTSFDLDTAQALVVSPDGSKVFVTGASTGSTPFYDYMTVAYDASTGSELWLRRYDGGSGNDAAVDVAVSPDGSTVFVTGTSDGSGTYTDYATVAYDASSGARLWARRYSRLGGPTPDAARAVGVTPDGSRVIVTGTSTDVQGDQDFATVAYDASTGATLWLKRFDRGTDDTASGLGVNPVGSDVYVTGRVGGPNVRNFDYGTIAYDASSGSKVWVARYDGPANGLDEATALAVSVDGSGVFVTGYTLRSRSNDAIATVAYAASDGTSMWVKHYDGAGIDFDAGRAIGVSPDGSAVFVAGISRRFTTSGDSVTLAYDSSTGRRIWLRAYEDTGIAHPSALAVSSNAVFVTGSTIGSTTRLDYVTVAYSTS